MRTHTSRLIMKFHSSPVWKFFLIKFHLLRLGFHHLITGRRAEMLIHAWFHHAPGEYQSMPPILFYFSLHLLLLASLLPSPSCTSILTRYLTASLFFFQFSYYPESLPFLLAFPIPIFYPCMAMSCYCLIPLRSSCDTAAGADHAILDNACESTRSGAERFRSVPEVALWSAPWRLGT